MHKDNLSSSPCHVIKVSKLQKYVLQHYKNEKGSYICNVFEKDDPKLPRKRKVLSYYEEREAPIEFLFKVEEYYLHFFIKRL